MQHFEFFDNDHFENDVHRMPPAAALSPFIDFFWETAFDTLWHRYPSGFSDVLFPTIGYTYIINLGTPFVMEQKGGKNYEMHSDGFLPRHSTLECHHVAGNHLFGIKFRISPLIYETGINFADYKENKLPLNYLLNKSILEKVKKADNLEERKDLLSNYFLSRFLPHEKEKGYATDILHLIEDSLQTNNFSKSVDLIAGELNISTRTLQRYFEITTGFGCKQALQMMRIRKAVSEIANDPQKFDYKAYGYYDYSHFYKHLRKFFGMTSNQQKALHLRLLLKLR